MLENWAFENSDTLSLVLLAMSGVVVTIVLIRFANTFFQTVTERREIYSNVIPITRAHKSKSAPQLKQSKSVIHPAFILLTLLAAALGMNVLLSPGRGIVSSSSRQVEQRLVGIVTHVRDGDTIEVQGKPIRLAKLDCAEENTLQGRVATRRMHTLTKGKSLTCRLSGRKSYDRWIGECTLRDGRDLGSVLIQEGYCKQWR